MELEPARTRVQRLLDALREGPKTTDDLVAMFGKIDARQVLASARKKGHNIIVTPISTDGGVRGGPKNTYTLSHLPIVRRSRGGYLERTSTWLVDEPGNLCVGATLRVRNGALVVTATVTTLEYVPVAEVSRG